MLTIQPLRSTSQATYQFDPYGNLVASTGTITNPFRFCGQYQDSESGLYYLRTRYFDSNTGQFVTRDPLATLTKQPYSYAINNPENNTDNSGKCSLPLWILMSSVCLEEKLGVYSKLRGTPIAKPLAAAMQWEGDQIGAATYYLQRNDVATVLLQAWQGCQAGAAQGEAAESVPWVGAFAVAGGCILGAIAAASGADVPAPIYPTSSAVFATGRTDLASTECGLLSWYSL